MAKRGTRAAQRLLKLSSHVDKIMESTCDDCRVLRPTCNKLLGMNAGSCVELGSVDALDG